MAEWKRSSGISYSFHLYQNEYVRHELRIGPSKRPLQNKAPGKNNGTTADKLELDAQFQKEGTGAWFWISTV